MRLMRLMRRDVLPFALFVALVASACASESSDWSYVYATTIEPSCTTSACHSSATKAGRLDLSSDHVAFKALTGRACATADVPAGGYVNVASPADSYLSLLLRRDGASGMPPNGRLPARQIDAIEAWMAGGARCD
jgi:hypothetical protein